MDRTRTQKCLAAWSMQRSVKLGAREAPRLFRRLLHLSMPWRVESSFSNATAWCIHTSLTPQLCTAEFCVVNWNLSVHLLEHHDERGATLLLCARQAGNCSNTD